MKNRFEGDDGQRRLVEALKRFEIVEHNEDLARFLAERGEVVEYAPDDDIVVQGGTDNDVYFILSGEAAVLINGRHVAMRGSGDAIGEMAAAEAGEPRSATVRARSQVAALKLSEPAFHDAGTANPALWMAIARVAAKRLRQRSAFVDVPNETPLLFLGCSTEALAMAEAIQLGLKYQSIAVRIWTQGVFSPGGYPLDDLLALRDAADFAVVLFSPDDTVVSRENEYNAPRDNVIFELGLFMGKLERRRVLVVHEHKSDVKIPSDLLGLTPITYINRGPEKLEVTVGTVCTEIASRVKELGTR